MQISYFITPHGFGHAARSCAVMETLQKKAPGCKFHIVTRTPEWFFRQSLGQFTHYDIRCDLGLVQTCPMHEDLRATLEVLDELHPFSSEYVEELSTQLTGTQLVICDVAALGILVAEHLGVPSIVIENFTWDWIYSGYLDTHPEFAEHIAYLREIRSRATYHIQTEPVCRPQTCDLTVNPVSRKPRADRAEVRRKLGVSEGEKLVLISMGGIQGTIPHAEKLRNLTDCHFIIPGCSETVERIGNITRLPQATKFFHPDLMGAADAVICKAGYSTIAECYNAGVPMGYILRERFPESKPFAEYIPSAMPSLQLRNKDWESGAWIDQLSALLQLPSISRMTPNGADQITEFVTSLEVGGSDHLPSSYC